MKTEALLTLATVPLGLVNSQQRYATRVKGLGLKKILVKEVAAKNNRLLLSLLSSEATNSRILSKYNSKSYSRLYFPKVYFFGRRKSKLILEREFIVGKLLKEYPNKFKIDVLTKCLVGFNEMTGRMKTVDLKMIPKRGVLSQIIMFPVYLVMATLKDPKNSLNLFRLITIFYSNCFSKNLFRAGFTISHRDLTSENIVIKGKRVNVIDLEILVYAEKGTDLALIPRYYYKEMERKRLIKFVAERLKTKEDLHTFFRLTVFYTIQFLAIANGNNRFYVEAKDYIKPFLENIMPALSTKVLVQEQSISNI